MTPNCCLTVCPSTGGCAMPPIGAYGASSRRATATFLAALYDDTRCEGVSTLEVFVWCLEIHTIRHNAQSYRNNGCWICCSAYNECLVRASCSLLWMGLGLDFMNLSSTWNGVNRCQLTHNFANVEWHFKLCQKEVKIKCFCFELTQVSTEPKGKKLEKFEMTQSLTSKHWAKKGWRF